ncbi:hypothetical protein HMPREF3226_01283 [Prevotella corporis]|uniref:Uncharacterized protein n=1 Tax=Prevotella corporis TaxID=28128 RepID=A0A133Q987_9BACT|nr:hypothetical protein HMPREF3226_01283 [Prevotella corporis]
MIDFGVERVKEGLALPKTMEQRSWHIPARHLSKWRQFHTLFTSVA